MKSYSQGKELAPIQPYDDASIKEAMRYEDRMPLDGLMVREASYKSWLLCDAAFNLKLFKFEEVSHA